MVLEIQLFLIHAFQKVVALCFHELGPWKNNCISRTIQRIQTTVTLVRTCTFQWYWYVGLICSLGCPQQKITKMYCLVIEEATHLIFQLRQHWTALKCRTLGAN